MPVGGADAQRMQAREHREAVSRSRLTDLLGGDEDGAHEVLSLFLAEIPRYQERLASVTSAQEFARFVHRLRGSLLSLGLLTDAARLTEIEHEARNAEAINSDAAGWIATLLPALAAETQHELVARQA